MNKARQRQLELPVLVNVNGKSSGAGSSERSAALASQAATVASGFHKPASADDQSIYKSISDSYFEAPAKQA
jgi:trans-2-enoyl-CoA reductase